MLTTVACAQVPQPMQRRDVDHDRSNAHIVLVSGDEEYRSEEAMPQLAKILTTHHGLRCTVLFALDEDGIINPNNQHNIPGLEALAEADLMIIATRFRDLPDEQMAHIDAYLKRGGPVIGLRTATHAFRVPGEKTYAHYGNGYNGPLAAWKGGFGVAILGEQWVAHHGGHGSQSTRGIVNATRQPHPILRGIKDGDIWGPTDVYTVRNAVAETCDVLVYGQVVEGMSFDDPPAEGAKNDPMMPVAWTRTYQIPDGRVGPAFTTTMGAATDLQAEGTRRLLVNAVYWALGMADAIPEEGTKVDIVGKYEPSDFGFGSFRKGLKPADYIN